jgi:hypothetical protein
VSNLSIRKLPKEVEAALLKRAESLHKTKSELVIEALTTYLGLETTEAAYDKLNAFFGQMSKKEFADFSERTQCFGEIDKDMWHESRS